MSKRAVDEDSRHSKHDMGLDDKRKYPAKEKSRACNAEQHVPVWVPR